MAPFIGSEEKERRGEARSRARAQADNGGCDLCA